MIAYSIAFLRHLFLMVALVLCSGYLLADPVFYLIERCNEPETNKPETGAAGTSTPGKTALAILEIIDSDWSYLPNGHSELGVNATPVDRVTAYEHMTDQIPRIKLSLHTLFFFYQPLFVLLNSGSGTNIDPAGELPEHFKKRHKLSIQLTRESIRNEEEVKKLIDRLDKLKDAQVIYRMTRYVFDKMNETMTITFDMYWNPDLEISKKKIAQFLYGHQDRLPALTGQNAWWQRATTDTTRDPDSALGEENLADTAQGNVPADIAADVHRSGVPLAAAATAGLLLLNRSTMKGK